MAKTCSVLRSPPPPVITSHSEPRKERCMKRSKDSSTELIISLPPVTSPSIPRWDGRSTYATVTSAAGLTNSIQVSASGIDGLLNKSINAALSEMHLDIESYILTVLTPYLHKQSPGDLKALSQKYALEVRCSSGLESPGSNFYFKYTIALCSKSQPTAGGKLLLSIPLRAICRFLYPTLTHSLSSGE